METDTVAETNDVRRGAGGTRTGDTSRGLSGLLKYMHTHVHMSVHVLITRRGDGMVGACSWFCSRRTYRVQRI